MDSTIKDHLIKILDNLVKEHIIALKKMPEKTETDKIRLAMVKNNLAIFMIIQVIVETIDGTPGVDVNTVFH